MDSLRLPDSGPWPVKKSTTCPTPDGVTWIRLQNLVGSVHDLKGRTVVALAEDVNNILNRVARLQHRVDKLEKWLEEAP